MKKLIFTISMCLGIALTIQAQTVKKVVIEDFTGSWCPNCPIGAKIIHDIKSANEAITFPVAVHTGDALAVSSFENQMGSVMQIQGVPSGFVDCHFFPGLGNPIYTTTLVGLDQFAVQTAFTQRKTATAIASVSFNAVSFDNASGQWQGDIKVTFNAAPTAGVPLAINLMVLEDSIPATGALAQANNESTIQNGANPLTNYFHNHVLRATSDGTWGDNSIIPGTGPVVGTAYTKHVSLTIPASYVRKNVHLLAYVAYNGTNPANNGKEIINSEEIGLLSGTTAIHEVNNTASFMGIYPNPARGNGLVSVEYNLNQSAKVTMTVYNALGQKVAEPYVSEDNQGMHTIQFLPSRYGIAKGMYLLQLSTDKGGAQSRRISID